MNAQVLEVAGLDLSLSSSGWASHHGIGLVRPTTKGERRLIEIRTAVLTATRGTQLAVIEGMSYASQYHREVLGGLHWVVRVGLFGNRIVSAVVPPTQLKLFATGNGHASKDDMVDAARAELLYGGRSDDEADAAWLRAVGMYAYALSPLARNADRDRIVNEVEWPTALFPQPEGVYV